MSDALRRLVWLLQAESKIQGLERRLQLSRDLYASRGWDPEPEMVRARIQLDQFKRKALLTRRALLSGAPGATCGDSVRGG